MLRGFAVVLPIAGFLFARSASAQEVIVESDAPPAAQPPPSPAETAPAPPPYERTTNGTPGEISEHDGPPPRRGFQMAIRTGYALPFGTVANGIRMRDITGGQVPFLFDIGGKVGDYVFVGGNAGFNIGGCADFAERDCVSLGLRFGPEIIVSLLPADRIDPWVGYGIGLELGGNASGQNDAVNTLGWELGHFMAGVDLRTSRGFGIGPFVDFSIGEYTELSVTTNDQGVSVPITSHALHEWLTLGVRFVILP